MFFLSLVLILTVCVFILEAQGKVLQSASSVVFMDSGQSLGNSTTSDVVLGDLDADGDLDAFTCNIGQQVGNSISGEANQVWLNDSSGTFVNSGQELGNSRCEGVAIGDLDGDGDLDIFVANGFNPQANHVWFNNGNGLFVDSMQTIGNSDSKYVVLGDLDSDGDLDAFVANWGANKVWLNDGNGYFSSSGQNLGNVNSEGVALGDLDGDDDLDAFVTNIKSTDPSKVYFNDGNSTFSDSGQTIGFVRSYAVDLDDLDSDGDLDAFVGNLNTPSKIWLNDGNGLLADSGQSIGNLITTSVQLGDLNGDGTIDAFLGNGGFFDPPQPNTVWLNDGSALFAQSQSLGNLNSDAVALGDLDGDSDLDAFVANGSYQVGLPNKVWVSVTPQVDLSVTKTDSPDPVIAGSTLTYTLEVSNNGPSAATGVIMTDDLPPGVTLVSAPGCSQAGGTVTCDLGHLASGAGRPVTLVVNVAPATTGTLINKASVAANVFDPNVLNNSTTEITVVDREADLALTKIDSLDPITAGKNLTYTLTITNNGPSDATGVKITDHLTSGVTFISAPGCSKTGDMITCNQGHLTSGGRAKFTLLVKVKADSREPFENEATVTARETDPNLLNNSAIAFTTVTVEADLVVTKTDFPDPVIGGNTLTYTLTVTNHGPSDATGVTLTDTLPAGVISISASDAYSVGAGLVIYKLGHLASQAGRPVTIVVKTAIDIPASLRNQARVTANERDPVPANNSVFEATTAIELISFRAKGMADNIRLLWETAAEFDNFGFNIWRSEKPDGPYTKLTINLLPAQGHSTTGASYAYSDTNVTKGVTYYYQLEDVDVQGISTFHGPVSAIASPIYQIYGPLMFK